MPLMFNSVLREAGVRPVDVRLLRHMDTHSTRGHTPYELWRDDRPSFEIYQSTQHVTNLAKLNAPYWASFVGTRSGETLFVGLYSRGSYRLMEQDTPKRQNPDEKDEAGTCHIYEVRLEEKLLDLVGRLFVEWGPGKLAWVQRADRNDKPVTELRTEFKEPEFPGFLDFIQPLSCIAGLPLSWVTALKASRGVYLLTCPRTKEQYVGSATGTDGFWGRWQDYVRTGHGGNIVLKSREPSDYQVSILEVAGTAATEPEIIGREWHWMRKLQSREMGLNSGSVAPRPGV
jgi:hypothetical protein